MNQITCQAEPGGVACIQAATLLEPVRLCDEHKFQVASAVLPDLLATALRDARLVNSRVLPPDLAHMVASAQAAPMPTTDPHSALVYFMANGGRVKIGYTKSLFSRIQALSLREDAVLLLLHGGPDLERALHAKFGAHRVADSEWFELAPDVVHFIAAKGPKHRTTRTRRPTRQKAPAPTPARSRGEQRKAAWQIVRALYDTLGRRPLESEMVAALKEAKLPHSRQVANLHRRQIEEAEPQLAVNGSAALDRTQLP